MRDYGLEGSYNTVRRYVERSRPRPTPRASERFETRPGHQPQVDWSHEQPIKTSSGFEQLTLRHTKRAGRIDWTATLLTDLTNTAKSWRISDHYPLFAQFALP